MKLFGTAGIRGLTNIELTPQFALDVVNAFSKLLHKKGKVAVARDTRYGALMLEQSVISGLLSNGIDAEDLGIVPTPTLASYVVSTKCDGGIMITGSHLPTDRIGMLLLQSDGSCLPHFIEEELEEIYFSRAWEKEERIKPEFIGTVVQSATAQFVHRDAIINKISKDAHSAIEKQKFRILLDPCNGTACGFIAGILTDLGCEALEINSEQAAIPSRKPEPKPENLHETVKAVVEKNCDFGAAYDTDADRVTFIDSRGNIISPDAVAGVFAKEIFSKEKGICVTPINASALIEQICAKYNSKVEYCRVGAPAISEKLKSTNASFGYEETGKYFFLPALWPDGLLATVELAAIMALRESSLAELIAEMPNYYQKKNAIDCTENKKSKIMEKVVKEWGGRNESDILKIVDVDGIKKIYTDNSWLLIRASGTEPLIRVFSEALSSKRAEELLSFGIDIVKEAEKVC